jgi:hypothetical protein
MASDVDGRVTSDKRAVTIDNYKSVATMPLKGKLF